MRKVITRAKFREWLEGHIPQGTVGFSASPYACPVATFYSQYFCMDEVAVAPDLDMLGYEVEWFSPYKGMCYHTLPAWANAFISLLDEVVEGHVRKEVALRILEDVS